MSHLIVAKNFDDAFRRICGHILRHGYAEAFIEDAGLGYDCRLKLRPGTTDADFRRYWKRLRNLQPFDIAVKPWSRWEMRDFWLVNANEFPMEAFAELERLGRRSG